MSATISKRLSQEFPIATHRPDLAIVTIVYNPDNKRLTTNMENVGIDECVKMLAVSMGMIANANANPFIISGNDIDKCFKDAIGVPV